MELGYSIFPLQFIKQCVETYTKDHGKAPKLLCVSEEDYMDWVITCTIESAKQLNLEMIRVPYLKAGQFDLAMGIEDDKCKK